MIDDVKICILVPYFGNLPNYFQLWLNSCAYNKRFNWIIYTDDRKQFDYPFNVTVLYDDFLSFKSKIQLFFEFEVNIPGPYKLCDFRPAFGEIFQNVFLGYHYWGYCDLDLIFGDIYKSIEMPLKLNFDKIFTRGHLSLIRNDYNLNRLYKTSSNFYIKVFTSPNHFTFDESRENGINSYFFVNKLSVYDDIPFSDIYFGSFEFYPRQLMTIKKIKQNSIFLWNKGVLTRFFLVNGKLSKSEEIYVHLQKRAMKMSNLNLLQDKFLVTPNLFENVTIQNELESILANKFTTKFIYLPYLYFRFNNMIKLIKSFLKLH